MSWSKINTSEFCFLCLKTTKFKTESEKWDGINIDNKSKESRENPPVSLLCLGRHLKINVNEIPGPCEAESIKNDKIKVNLCEDCKKVVCKFSDLFQHLEKTQMEMDFYLEKINFYIEKGLEDSERVQAYSKGMTNKADTLSQLAWIDKLRKEICKKCSKMRSASHPNVEINKMEIQSKSITPFVKEEETSEVEFNDEDYSPPASPPVPHSESNSIKDETEHTEKPTQKEFKMDKNTGRIHCPSCDQTFTQKHAAQAHFNVVHLKEKWKCDFCSVEICAYPVGIRNHKKACRVRNPKPFEQPKAREHFKFTCDVCNKKFPNRKHLNDHKWRVHDTSKPYLCKRCGKGFKYDSYLKTHNEMVHLGRRWSCKYCQKSFSASSNCTRHERKCLMKKEIKVENRIPLKPEFYRDLTGRVACPDCSKTFAEVYPARLHYDAVHLKKRVKCDLCNFATFAYPRGLDRHKETCTGVIPQTCSCKTCGKGFHARAYLLRHQRLHSRKDFKCDLCEKTFKRAVSLRAHKDCVHLKKRISCKYCKRQVKPTNQYTHKWRCRKKILGIKSESTKETSESIAMTRDNDNIPENDK